VRYSRKVHQLFFKVWEKTLVYYTEKQCTRPLNWVNKHGFISSSSYMKW